MFLEIVHLLPAVQLISYFLSLLLSSFIIFIFFLHISYLIFSLVLDLSIIYMFGKCRLQLELWFQVEIFLLRYLETHARVLYLKTDGNYHMNTPCGWFSVSINLQLRRLIQASAIIGRRENKNGED